MIRVTGYFLYNTGQRLHELHGLQYERPGVSATKHGDAFLPLYNAKDALSVLLTGSVFQLKTSYLVGKQLLAAIETLSLQIRAENDVSKELTFTQVFSVTKKLEEFEAVLSAEFELMPLYIIGQKSGFDTITLIDGGQICFPPELATKAPEAMLDIQQGTRCLALEAYTASAFHFYRATETILRKYWDVISNGAPHPKRKTMGAYLYAMGKLDVGDPKVKAALTSLKDLHRNPVMHPEYSIKDSNEAIALMYGVHNVITHMLMIILD